jgi:hypothetical protein
MLPVDSSWLSALLARFTKYPLMLEYLPLQAQCLLPAALISSAIVGQKKE